MSYDYRPAGDTERNRGNGIERAQATTPARQTIFEVFSARRRRWLLAYVSATPAAVVPVDDAAAQLERWERAVGDADPGLGQRIETSLHHAHLPKLTDAGLVEYDDRHGVLRYDGDDRVEQFLELVSTPE